MSTLVDCTLLGSLRTLARRCGGPGDPSRSPEQGVSCESRNVRLLANPIGADASVRTETIHIQPGQFIEWRLESQLARSTVAVY